MGMFQTQWVCGLSIFYKLETIDKIIPALSLADKFLSNNSFNSGTLDSALIGLFRLSSSLPHCTLFISRVTLVLMPAAFNRAAMAFDLLLASNWTYLLWLGARERQFSSRRCREPCPQAPLRAAQQL